MCSAAASAARTSTSEKTPDGSAAAATRTGARPPSFTGWDVDGGYVDACLADERFVHRLPDGRSDEHAAPLMCAGGYTC